MIKLLRKLFGKTKAGRIIKKWEHRGWGNSIMWTDEGTLNKDELLDIHGHITPRIQKGDIILSEFGKGVLVLDVAKIRHCDDPHDMFFAELKARGYFTINGKRAITRADMPKHELTPGDIVIDHCH